MDEQRFCDACGREISLIDIFVRARSTDPVYGEDTYGIWDLCGWGCVRHVATEQTLKSLGESTANCYVLSVSDGTS